MSSFVGLHTALTGIRAGQVGLDTASHNVSNANTPGYTRQRVGLAQRAPFTSAVGPIGAGVDVTGINRLREGFLDNRVRTTGANFAYDDARASLLQRAETVLAEPELGLSVALADVWNAFDDLALDPNDGAARRQVVAALDAMDARFAAISVGWGQLETDTVTRLDTGIDEANTLLAQVASLNVHIAGAAGNSVPPNDALDARDAALDRLANLTGATFAANPSVGAMIDVTISGQKVVDGTAVHVLQRVPNTTDISVVSSGAAVAPGGQLGGVKEFLDTDLGLGAPGSMRAALDQLATDLVDAVNAQHEQGAWYDGSTGTWVTNTPLLGFAAGTGPLAERLALAISGPEQLAAAQGAPLPSGPSVHDGRNAAALGALRDGAPDDGLRNLVIEVARKVSTTTRAADSGEGIYTSATVARQSAHGVSIDEEMVSLVQHQRALEAASRVMTALDEALDVLINRTGLVGR